MNLRQRRAERTKARKQPTGYLERMFAYQLHRGLTRGAVHFMTIRHDRWCGIYRGEGCNCVPDMSCRREDGTEIDVIHADGSVTTTRVC